MLLLLLQPTLPLQSFATCPCLSLPLVLLLLRLEQACSLLSLKTSPRLLCIESLQCLLRTRHQFLPHGLRLLGRAGSLRSRPLGTSLQAEACSTCGSHLQFCLTVQASRALPCRLY